MEEHEGEESDVENVDGSDEDAEEDQREGVIDTEVLRIGKRTCSAFSLRQESYGQSHLAVLLLPADVCRSVYVALPLLVQLSIPQLFFSHDFVVSHAGGSPPRAAHGRGSS